jgi:hypothetical protein
MDDHDSNDRSRRDPRDPLRVGIVCAVGIAGALVGDLLAFITGASPTARGFLMAIIGGVAGIGAAVVVIRKAVNEPKK